MYQFSKGLKIIAVVLMVLGAAGTVISFINTPKTLEEAKEIMAAQVASFHGDEHSSASHSQSNESYDTHTKHKTVTTTVNSTQDSLQHHSTEQHTVVPDSETLLPEDRDSIDKSENVMHLASDKVKQEAHVATHNATAHGKGHGDAHGDDHHAEHVFHQMQNRPVAAFYVPMLFFLGISLLVLAFYAAQRVAHAGWSVVLFRVFEAISSSMHYISIFMLLFIIGTAMHYFHLFPWMADGTFDPQSPNFDPIVDAKKWWMNLPGWTIRSIVYLVLWNLFRFVIRKKSIKQDNGNSKLHKNIYNWSVGFIVIFLITESLMSWDWIMGIDPHWFSTLFGWYVLATLLVSALTVVAIVTLYLRSKGALPLVNDSHIHDLAKFMFGFSVFWTYLWFAQFMLIWYADMPEETTYFLQRFNEYKLPFLAMVVMNFIFPVLVLLNSDFKSMPWFVIIAGLFILVGHYIDLYVMIMPGTVGGQYGFGIGEISALLFFIGLFIFATFSSFARANPVPKGNPFLHESETFHYYNITHRGEKEAHH